MLCNLCNLRSSSGANFLIGRMLNGGNGVGGGEPKQHSDVQQDDVIFPLQDTDPEESPSSAASTAFRQDLSDSQRNAFANGSGNLAGEIDDDKALCTCEDGEVRL